MAINRPRSAQINDVKQHFTVYPGSIAGSEVYLSDVNSYSVTKTLGGALEESPAYMVVPNKGPYSLSSTSILNITIPGINAGAAVPVTIQSGDIVWGKVPTNRLVDRINSAFSAYTSALVAANERGRVSLTSVTTSGLLKGDSAYITLANNSNLLQYLGYANGTTTVTVTGAGAYTRGVVTKGPLGTGGRVLLKAVSDIPGQGTSSQYVTSDPSAADKISGGFGSRTTELKDILRNCTEVSFSANYYADPGDGGEVSGRFTPLNDGTDTLRFETFRPGQAKAYVQSGTGGQSDFSALAPGDHIIASLMSTDTGDTREYTYTWSSAPASVSDLVSMINSDYVTTSGSYAQAVTSSGGPFYLPAGSFKVQFGDSGTSITVMIASGTYTVSSLVVLVNNAITSQASGQGTALPVSVAINSKTGTPAFTGLGIRSSSADHINTYVKILTSDDGELGVLNGLGIKPGRYGASYLVEPFGSDEIRFVNNVRVSGSSVTIRSTSDPTTLTKLGILANATGLSSYAEEPIEVSNSYFVFPEVMSLGEIPAGADSIYNSIQTRGVSKPVPPNLGLLSVANQASNSTLNGGPLDMLLHSLGVQSINLGVNQTSSESGLLNSRLNTATNRSVEYTLVHEARESDLSYVCNRIYVDGSQNLVITWNARRIAEATWQKDDSTLYSYKTALPINSATYSFNASGVGAFNDSSWIPAATIGKFPLSPGQALFNVDGNATGLTGSNNSVFKNFNTLLTGSNNVQLLNQLVSSVTNSQVRTYQIGYGVAYTINASISITGAVTNITKDVAGGSWVLLFLAGSSPGASGLSVWYDSDTSTSRVLTDYVKVFVAGTDNFMVGKPITGTDAMFAGAGSLIDQSLATGKTKLNLTTIRNATAGTLIQQSFDTVSVALGINTGFNISFDGTSWVKNGTTAFKTSEASSSAVPYLKQYFRYLSGDTNPWIYGEDIISDNSSSPRRVITSYQTDRSDRVFSSESVGVKASRTGVELGRTRMFFGSGWGSPFNTAISSVNSVYAVGPNTTFYEDEWHCDDETTQASLVAYTPEGMKLLTHEGTASSWSSNDWKLRSEIVPDNSVLARATFKATKIASGNVVITVESSYNVASIAYADTYILLLMFGRASETAKSYTISTTSYNTDTSINTPMVYSVVPSGRFDYGFTLGICRTTYNVSAAGIKMMGLTAAFPDSFTDIILDVVCIGR